MALRMAWPLFLSMGAGLMTSLAAAQPPLRVACVGDSITYGDQIPDRARDAYPAVLERLSAGRLLTGNFGVNGATALQTPFRDWSRTRAARDALAFNPDIVVVMLGINDLAYPGLHDRFPDDLRAIVARFQALPPAPRLFLCTLTPIAPAEHQAHANRTIRDTMNPAIRAVAAQTGAHVIDISAAFPNRLDLLPDGLHPSPEGARLIARTVLAAIDQALSPATPVQSAPVAGPPDLSIRHEALAARHRAEQWLQHQPAPEGLRDPADEWTGRDLRSPDDVAHLLPLLEGTIPDGLGNPLHSFAALAIALDRIGHETVFLAGNRPVAWREALLHQLVMRQHIEPDGGGYWIPPEQKANNAVVVESTTYALRAIATALGE
jgi:lysophospholipase L1-like esterase